MKTFRALLLAATVSLIAACASTPKTSAPAAPPLAAPIVSVAGNWTMTIESPQGAQDSKMVLTQTGKDIAGSLDTPMGSQKIAGTYDGKAIAFNFNVSAQGMELKVVFTGISDGKTMSGKAVFGTFGEGSFKGVRQ